MNVNLQPVKDLARAIAADFTCTAAEMAEVRFTHGNSQCCHGFWVTHNAGCYALCCMRDTCDSRNKALTT